MTYGPDITRDHPLVGWKDEKPSWLPAGQRVRAFGVDGGISEGPAFNFHWSRVAHIALPLLECQHAYDAIEAGFVPWFGGESEPSDWDGGDVLHSDGAVAMATGLGWKWGWPHNPKRVMGDVIGYHRRADPDRCLGNIPLQSAEQPADESTITDADMDAALRHGFGDRIVDAMTEQSASPPTLPTEAEDFLTQLRRVNTERYNAWAEGDDAGIMFDAIELGGEVGELLNVVKKLEREERGWRGSRATDADFADECGDVLICLDKLARRRGVDLARATARKFNATSDKQGFPHKLVELREGGR
jgi:NTP pyrophosphatase (non-canonical NTP hydrolase)